MRIQRDNADHFACLEYSWIAEGKRDTIPDRMGKREHMLGLGPGQPQGVQTTMVTVQASKVQVYVLTSIEPHRAGASIEIPFFPLGKSPSAPLIRANIEVFQKRMEVVTTAYYADGSALSDTHKLDDYPRLCPHESRDDE
jgi:hypothetical protein